MKNFGKGYIDFLRISIIATAVLFVGLSIYSLCCSSENKIAKTEDTYTEKIDDEKISKKKISKVINMNDVQEEEEEQAEEEQQQENEQEESQEPEQPSQQQSRTVNTQQGISSTYKFSNGATYSIAGYVEIPSLSIKYPIIANHTDAALKVSITKYWGSNPNEVGNCCLLGHNYKNSKFFGNLVNIKNGTVIKMTDLSGRVVDYTVYETGVIAPEDTSCTSQLTDGHTEVTLITCYYVNGEAHASKRFYVKARAN